MAKKQPKKEEIEVEEIDEDELADLEEEEEEVEIDEDEELEEALEEALEEEELELEEEEEVEVEKPKKPKKKAPAKKKAPEVTIADIKVNSMISDLHGKKMKITQKVLDQMKAFEKANPKNHAVWRNKVTGLFLFWKMNQDNPKTKK